MIIKGLLKFSLPALLLFASASAFADGPVTLSDNKTTVTWEQFANAINNPDDVTGKIEDLSANNSAMRALATANKNLSDAETALEDLKTAQSEADQAKKDADGEVTAAQTAVTTAEGNLTKANNDSIALVDAAQKDLDDAKKELAEYTTSKDSLATVKAGYVADSTSVAGRLSTAQSNLRTYKVQLAGLAKVTETKTDTLPWMKQIFKCADSFEQGYNSNPKLADPTIYYKIDEKEETGWDEDLKEEIVIEKFVTAILSFSTTQPAGTGWLKVSPRSFSTKFLASSVTTSANNKVTTIDYLQLYMGPEYAALNNNNEYYTVGSYQGNRKYILNLSVEAVKTMAGQSKYVTTTQVVTDKYIDQAAADAIEGYIIDTENEIKGYEKQINGVHKDAEGNLPEGETKEVDGYKDLINKAQSQITTLEGKIKVLNETTIPNLEQAVEDAKDDEETTAAIASAKEALATANQTLKDKQDAADAAQTALTNATTAVTNANNNLPSLRQAVTTATNNAQDAANAQALSYYTTGITLTADIDATTAVTKTYSGEIHADGHLINIAIAEGTQTTLFKTFSGQLYNAAINGTFGSSTGAGRYENVVTWTGTSGNVYNASGTKTLDGETDFGKLGFAIRDNQDFGVNFMTGKLVAASAAPSKVFNVTVNDFLNGAESNSVPTYVQNINGVLTNVDKAAVTIPVNRFAFCSTDDLDGIDNIYYGTPGAYVSKSVVIADKENFYSPAQITTEKVTMNRALTPGYNTICLPFALQYRAGISSICNYDRVDTEKFWFTKINEEDALPANTPGLVYATGAFDAIVIDSDVVIAKTDASQIVKAEGALGTAGKSDSYGTFKQVNAGQFKGEADSKCIYGLNSKTGHFQAGAESAVFPAFRMVIATAEPAAPLNAAKRSLGEGVYDVKAIAIQDENGIEITDEVVTGINSATADATSLNVVGGQSEIIFTADADYGKVEVYSINGGVVAIADVITGTTTVNVPSGIYIVMGQKVMVK